MKTVFYKRVFLLLTFIGLFACKKGENDPFLSLRTRKSRLAGEWILTGITGKYVSRSNTAVTNSTTVFLDGILTESSTTDFFIGNQSSVTNSTYGKYSYALSFGKDGTYSLKKELLFPSGNKKYVITESGNWVFVGKSKNEDLKAKEAIQLLVKNANSVYYDDNQSNDISDVFITNLDSYNSGEILYLDRLTNKELLVKVNSKEIHAIDGSYYEITREINETFKAK